MKLELTVQYKYTANLFDDLTAFTKTISLILIFLKPKQFSELQAVEFLHSLVANPDSKAGRIPYFLENWPTFENKPI